MKNNSNDDRTYTVKMFDLRNAFYEAGDPRRRPEREDGRMIGKDNTTFASCPPIGFQRYFPGRPWSED